MNFAVRFLLSLLLLIFHPAAIAQDSTRSSEPLDWIYTWSSDDTLDDTVGEDTDILYTTFDRESNTWSSPYPLNPDAETDTESDYAPQLLTDFDGNRFVLWMSGPATERTVQRAQYDEEMEKWSDPAQVGGAFEADEIPQISVDDDGNMMMVWSSRNTLNDTIGSDPDILFSHYQPVNDVWHAPATVNEDATTDGDLDLDGYPQIVADGQGGWIASWSQLHHTGSRIARYDPDSSTWSPLPTPVSMHYPEFSLGSNGDMVVIWQTHSALGLTDIDLLFSIYDPLTEIWTNPVQINDDPLTGAPDERNEIPTVAYDGQNKWMVMWRTSILDMFYNAEFKIYDRATNAWSVQRYLSQEFVGRVSSDGQGNWINIRSRSTANSPHGNPTDFVLESAVYNESTNEWTETTPVFTDYVPREDVSDENGSGSGSSGSSPCFIATAAYGTPLARELDTLRDFRDTRLLINPLGAAFTDSYYRVSPPIADIVGRNPLLASLTRAIINLVSAIVSLETSTYLLVMSTIALSLGMAIPRFTRTRHRNDR
jgi:hypothetical protein